MNRMQRIAAGGALLVGSTFAAMPAISFAQQPPVVSPAQVNGARGLVNAIVAFNSSGQQVGLVNVGNSLNNLTALNNVLNNSPILSNNNITVTHVIGNITVGDVLSNDLNSVTITALNNALNGNQVVVQDLVNVLSGLPAGTPVTLLTTAAGQVLALV